MRFLLDTNIISAYLKGDRQLFNSFMQYGGGLTTSAICAGELYAWVHRTKSNPAYVRALEDFFSDVQILPVDAEVAKTFGVVRAELLDQGRPTPTADLLIACTAITYDLTLVTHNVRDFAHVRRLRVDDWLI